MTIKHRLCIDIDNVIAATDVVMREVISSLTAGRVVLRRADVKHFDYWRCADSRGQAIDRTEWTEIHALFSTPRYLWQVEPIEGAREGLQELSQAYDLHLVTSRLPEARRTTIEWLEYYRFPNHGLHFVTYGEKHVIFEGFQAAVEDDYSQAIEFARSGVECCLLAHPWNENKPESDGIRRAKSWGEIVTYLSGH